MDSASFRDGGLLMSLERILKNLAGISTDKQRDDIAAFQNALKAMPWETHQKLFFAAMKLMNTFRQLDSNLSLPVLLTKDLQDMSNTMDETMKAMPKEVCDRFLPGGVRAEKIDLSDVKGFDFSKPDLGLLMNVGIEGGYGIPLCDCPDCVAARDRKRKMQ